MSKSDKSQCTQMYGTTLFAYLWVNAGLFWLVPSALMVSPTQNVDALTNAEFLQTVWFRSFYGFFIMYVQPIIKSICCSSPHP